jgi:hypothetical protein
MTLNQSALLELTDVLRTANGGKVMRLMLSAMPRPPPISAPTPISAHQNGRPNATAPPRRPSRPRPGT